MCPENADVLHTDVHRVISSRDNAGAYYVQKIGDEVIETSLETKILS